MNEKIAIIFIGTNKYINFFPQYYGALENHFLKDCPKTYFAFTDQVDQHFLNYDNVVKIKVDHLDWPFITLYRFKFINQIKEKLEEFDWIFFIDADLIAASEITKDDILNHGKSLIGVQHPGFMGIIGSFETNGNSTANILDGYYDLKEYRQGCLWGGKSKQFIDMIIELDRRVDADLEKEVVAVWHDESHMNKYFVENNSDVFTLHAGFATPQQGYDHIKANFETKFIHLYKDLNEFPRFAYSR